MDAKVTDLCFERPALKQFRRLSPSRYTAMQTCLLREVWTASGNNSLLPPSPRAELGSIAHRILEVAGRGELEGVGIEGINERWNALVSEAEARMELSPLRRHQVPLSLSVPDFQVRRLRTCRRAIEIARDAHWRFGSLPEHSQRATGFELWVESEDSKVGGFIDRASVTTEGVVLSDYKSGAVLESEHEERPGELKKAYKLQMQLYAALYRQKMGAWPVKLEVIPLQGEPLDVSLDPGHAENLLHEAKESLWTANNRIAAVQDRTADATALATAQPEYCRLCLFRPACETYWIARQNHADGKWPVDVRGIFRESMRLRNGKICLRIEETGSSTSSFATIRNVTDSPNRHPLINSMSAGTRVTVYGLKRDYRSSDYTETQSTVIYRMD